MTSLLQHTYTDEELYPSFDGNPMAENTLQYDWIVLIKENLERLFIDREDVFIAGDLLWYPIRVTAPPAPRQAPDVMVVFGRPKGHRKSYRQQEEGNIAPQVAFEILSDSNKTREGREKMADKFAFYNKYGIEEYYIIDPDTYHLQGWLRQGEDLLPIKHVDNWVSPRLGVRFRTMEKLQLFFPDNSPFLSPIELSKSLQQAQQVAEIERQQRQQAQQAAEQAQQAAEIERQQRQQAQQAAEQAQQVAEIERQQRQQAQQAAEIERLSNQKLKEKLRSLGIDPDQDI